MSYTAWLRALLREVEREVYPSVREVEREVYPSVRELEQERHRTTLSCKTEPAEDFRPEVLLDGLVTIGG